MTDSIVPTTPWYKSQILQGIIIAVVAQALTHSGLISIITPDQGVAVVNYCLESLSFAAAAYAARARLVGPVHPIAGTKTAQAAVDAAIVSTPPQVTPNAQSPPAAPTSAPSAGP
jgi:hypothetical protein